MCIPLNALINASNLFTTFASCLVKVPLATTFSLTLNQLSSLLQPPKQNDETPISKEEEEEEEGKNARHLPDWIVGAASRVKLSSSKVKNGTDNKKLAKSKGRFTIHFVHTFPGSAYLDFV